jgi:hypothetical protein
VKTAADKVVGMSVLYLKFTNGPRPGTVNVTYACNNPAIKSQQPFVLTVGELDANMNWNARKTLQEWKGLAAHMQGSTAPENHAFIETFIGGRDVNAKKKLFDLIAEQVLMPMVDMDPEARKKFSKVIRFNVTLMESFAFTLVHQASVERISSTTAFIYASTLVSEFPDILTLEDLFITAALSEDPIHQEISKVLRKAYEMDMDPLGGGDIDSLPVTTLNDYLTKMEKKEEEQATLEGEGAIDENSGPLEYPALNDMQGEFEKVAGEPILNGIDDRAYAFVSLALDYLEQSISPLQLRAAVDVSDENIRPLHLLLPTKVEVNKSFAAKLPTELMRSIQTKLIESGEASQEDLTKLESNEEVTTTVTIQTLEIPDYVKFLQDGFTVGKMVEVVYGPYNVTQLIEGAKLPIGSLVAEA